MIKSSEFILPNNLRGRSLSEKVIPTVCNLKNMLHKLVKVNGDYSQLKQWEKRSYKAYRIEDIEKKILSASEDECKELIRNQLLTINPIFLGASAVDIYLVAYVAETYGVGKDIFFHYIKDTRISSEGNSAQAIWQVGKGDGVYLDILHDDGRVKDWSFFRKWIGMI